MKASDMITSHPLELFTIYDHPRDYPDQFVCRRSEVTPTEIRPMEIVAAGQTLEECRDTLTRHFPGLHCLGRQPEDDPVIVEVWV